MIVIPPITLNSSNITSSALGTGDPGTTWSSLGVYAYGTRVKVAGTVNKIYEFISATDTNSTDSPEIDVLKPTPKWFEVGSTNKYKMFDNLSDSYTEASTSLTVTITPGMTTAGLAVTNLNNVTQVVITGYSTYPTSVWTKTFTPTANYLIENSTLYIGIPATATQFILTFTGTGTFYVGNVLLGNIYYNIGKLQNGATSTVLNFSSLDRDTYGNAVLIKRRSVTKIMHKLFIKSNQVTSLTQLKDTLNTVSAIWSGMDDNSTDPYFSALLTLGFYREFSFEIDNPIGPMLNLEIEEV
jgi:hypothetical protein